MSIHQQLSRSKKHNLAVGFRAWGLDLINSLGFRVWGSGFGA